MNSFRVPLIRHKWTTPHFPLAVWFTLFPDEFQRPFSVKSNPIFNGIPTCLQSHSFDRVGQGGKGASIAGAEGWLSCVHLDKTPSSTFLSIFSFQNLRQSENETWNRVFCKLPFPTKYIHLRKRMHRLSNVKLTLLKKKNIWGKLNTIFLINKTNAGTFSTNSY